MPWNVTASVKAHGVRGERVCLRALADEAASAACSSARGCCKARLHKVELLTREACRGSIAASSAPVSWAADRPVVSFAAKDLPQGAVFEACFELRKPSCLSLRDLCPGGTCKYAVFNPPSGRACCPAKTFSADFVAGR
jgi:hypothetical protein